MQQESLGARAARWIATSGGLGDRVSAPGTVAGSFPAAAVWWLVAAALPTATAALTATALMTALATAVGVWAAGVEARRRGGKDPGAVVIDEVAGQWLTYLVAGPWIPLADRLDAAAFAAAGFFLFRVLDIVKPWPIRRFEQLPGGVGIVADDLVAGIGAGAVLAAVYLSLT